MSYWIIVLRSLLIQRDLTNHAHIIKCWKKFGIHFCRHVFFNFSILLYLFSLTFSLSPLLSVYLSFLKSCLEQKNADQPSDWSPDKIIFQIKLCLVLSVQYILGWKMILSNALFNTKSSLLTLLKDNIKRLCKGKRLNHLK